MTGFGELPAAFPETPSGHGEEDRVPIRVLGIGNLLWSDDGFGIRALEALWASKRVPGEVPLVDGGTQGLNLLSLVRTTRRLLLFDAVDACLSPGTLRLFKTGEIPALMALGKASLHQSTFQEVLALASLFGESPEEIALVGIQPVTLEEFGGGLTPTVASRIPEAVEMALEILTTWIALEAESG